MRVRAPRLLQPLRNDPAVEGLKIKWAVIKKLSVMRQTAGRLRVLQFGQISSQNELFFPRPKAPLNKGMRNAVLLISSRALTPPPTVAASTQAPLGFGSFQLPLRRTI